MGIGNGFAIQSSVEETERSDSKEESDKDTKKSETDGLLVEVVDGLEDVVVGLEEGEHHREGEAGVDT